MSDSLPLRPPIPPSQGSPYAPPKTDVEKPFTYMGNSMTEMDFQRARRHNVFRWIVSSIFMVLALAVIILLVPGTVIKLLAFGGAGSGIYVMTTEMFPGPKIFGSTLYRKYEVHRDLQISRREREKKAAS